MLAAWLALVGFPLSVKAPVIVVLPSLFTLSARLFVTVVEKLASSFKAAANSFNVSKAAGAESTTPATCVST